MAQKVLVDRFDHIVLTVSDIEAATLFYERVLGFEREIFQGPEGQPRYALRFGNQKINLQDRATATPTKATTPTFGSADFCVIAAVVTVAPSRCRSSTGLSQRREQRPCRTS